MLMIVKLLDPEDSRQILNSDRAGGYVTCVRARMGNYCTLCSRRAYGHMCVTRNLIVSIGVFGTCGVRLVTGYMHRAQPHSEK